MTLAGRVLVHCLIGQDMDSDGNGQKDEEQTEGPVLCDKDGAVQKSKPYHTD